MDKCSSAIYTLTTTLCSRRRRRCRRRAKRRAVLDTSLPHPSIDILWQAACQTVDEREAGSDRPASYAKKMKTRSVLAREK